MFLIRMAWDNLWYNRKRTLLVIALMVIACCAMALFNGYVDYAREGMKLGFIAKDGNLQLKKAGEAGEEPLFDAGELAKIYQILAGYAEIKEHEAVINFNGLIGNEGASEIFWGKAYDAAYLKQSVVAGAPLFAGDAEELLMGDALGKKLGLHTDSFALGQEAPYVNIMTSAADSGLLLGTFKTAGLVSTGVIQNDSGLVVMARESFLRFFGLDEAASYIQIYLHNDEALQTVKARLANDFKAKGLTAALADWQELNPNYRQVNSLNEIQSSVINIILSVLVFVALTQALSTAFSERLNEFGMLEAVGMPKSRLFLLLFCEVFFLAAIGIGCGIALAFFTDFIVGKLNVTLVFPGYTAGYALRFFFIPARVAGTAFFILAVAFLAMARPLYHVLKNSIAKLIYHSY